MLTPATPVNAKRTDYSPALLGSAREFSAANEVTPAFLISNETCIILPTTILKRETMAQKAAAA